MQFDTNDSTTPVPTDKYLLTKFSLCSALKDFLHDWNFAIISIIFRVVFSTKPKYDLTINHKNSIPFVQMHWTWCLAVCY